MIHQYFRCFSYYHGLWCCYPMMHCSISLCLSSLTHHIRSVKLIYTSKLIFHTMRFCSPPLSPVLIIFVSLERSLALLIPVTPSRLHLIFSELHLTVQGHQICVNYNLLLCYSRSLFSDITYLASIFQASQSFAKLISECVSQCITYLES